MKKIFLMTFVSTLFGTGIFAQTSDMLAIEQTIIAFVEAADHNDATSLDQQLDDHFRIIMNRLFGSKEVSIMPKSDYLQKIKSKEFGGDTRTITIHSIVVNGTIANVNLTLKGKEMTFTSLLTLLKNNEGKWLIISDAPMI